MKKNLLFLLLVAGCTSAPKEDAKHQAISAYLQKHLDDPASYQPVSWSKEQVWRKADDAHADIDAARLVALNDSLEIGRKHEMYEGAVGLAKLNPTAKNKADIPAYKTKWQQAIAQSAASQRRVDSLRAVTDTTRLGYLITHVYRAKNKSAALVLDSTRFEVDTKGQVKVWDSFKK